MAKPNYQYEKRAKELAKKKKKEEKLRRKQERGSAQEGFEPGEGGEENAAAPEQATQQE